MMIGEEDEKRWKEIVSLQYPADPLEVLGECNFKEPREIPPDEIGSPVQDFFHDATIFITGGTGYVGVVLLEKLLRSCPQVSHLYLLVRNKKEKSPEERLVELFEDRIYNRLKHEVPNYIKKVSAIAGDMKEPGLGISDADRKKLAAQVDIVYHCAASIRFDEGIKDAIYNNVLGTRELLKLCKTWQKLRDDGTRLVFQPDQNSITNYNKLLLFDLGTIDSVLVAFMHTSTAYSFCNAQVIEEEIPPSMLNSYNSIIENILSKTSEELELEESKLIMGWPNTYAFSKAIAESSVQNESQGMAVAIFRPSVVMPTYREPVKGWVNNMNGAIGLMVGSCVGLLHVIKVNPDACINMVPVDFTVNALICATKETAEYYQAEVSSNEKQIPIYNYTNVSSNPMKWRTMNALIRLYIEEWPSIEALWIYSLILTQSKIAADVLWFMLHTVVGYIFDRFLILNGRKPFLSNMYKKIYKMRNTLEYFMEHEWTFKRDRVSRLWAHLTPEDKELFFFDMTQLAWERYMYCIVLGFRVYLLKDDIYTLPAARRQYRRLHYTHVVLKYLFLGLMLVISTIICSKCMEIVLR